MHLQFVLLIVPEDINSIHKFKLPGLEVFEHKHLQFVLICLILALSYWGCTQYELFQKKEPYDVHTWRKYQYLEQLPFHHDFHEKRHHL